MKKQKLMKPGIKNDKEWTEDTPKEKCPGDGDNMPMLVSNNDDDEAPQKTFNFKKPTNIPKPSHHKPKSFSTKPVPQANHTQDVRNQNKGYQYISLSL